MDINRVPVGQNVFVEKVFEDRARLSTVAAGEGLHRALAAGRRAAYDRGFLGCFLDDEKQPDWARKIARYEADRFRDEAEWARAEDFMLGDIEGMGKGKRALPYLAYQKLDREALVLTQDYGNCTMCSGAEACGVVIGADVLLEKKEQEYSWKVGTALSYGSRGHRGQGSALSTAARIYHTIGLQFRTTYGKWDFTDENQDEYLGNKWGGSGPPKELVEAVRASGNRMEQAAPISDEQAVLDLLYAGGVVHVGSTVTAADYGDPISALRTPANHAELLMGYDDTDEFRQWYQEKTGKQINDWVGIWDQTWGNWNDVDNWPDHLWGPRPEGAFVLAGRDTMHKVAQTAYGYGNSIGMPPRPLDLTLI